MPDDFYGVLICAARGMAPRELGLDHLGGESAQPFDVRYPPTPEGAFGAVGRLWCAGLNGYEPLVLSDATRSARDEASLRWLVAPEPSTPA